MSNLVSKITSGINYINNTIKTTAYATALSLAMIGTANADSGAAGSTTFWGNDRSEYGVTQTVRANTDLLDNEISLDAVFHHIPQTQSTQASGFVQYADTVEIGGGYVDDATLDWAGYVAVIPSFEIQSRYFDANAGVRIALGAASMSDYNPGARTLWGQQGPDEVDMYSLYTHLWLSTKFKPTDFLHVSASAYGQAFAAVAPYHARPFTRSLDAVAQYTDISTSLALSDARAGARGQVDLRIINTDTLKLEISYSEMWDLIVNDIGYFVYQQIEEEKEFDLPDIPFRQTRQAAIRLSLRGEKQNSLDFEVMAQHISGSSTADSLLDRNGWIIAGQISARYERFFVQAGGWFHLNRSDREEFFGEIPRAGAWGSIGAILVDEQDSSLSFSFDAGVNTQTNRWGVAQEGVIAMLNLRYEFGATKSFDANRFDPPMRQRVTAPARPYTLASVEQAIGSETRSLTAQNIGLVNQNVLQIPQTNPTQVVQGPSNQSAPLGPELPLTTIEPGSSPMEINPGTVNEVVNAFSPQEIEEVVKSVNSIDLSNPETIEQEITRNESLITRVDQIIPGFSATAITFARAVADQGVFNDHTLILTGYRPGHTLVRGLIRTPAGYGSTNLLPRRRASAQADLRRTDRIAYDFAILDRVDEFGRRERLEKISLANARTVQFQGVSRRIRILQRMSGRR